MGLILGTQLLAANVTQPYPDPGLKRTPIKVALLSLPPRTQSLLEFFFTNAGRGSFMACTEEQAETAIFDLDTPASRDHWLAYNARTGCPGIALAVKPQEVPGALWVQKPVTPAALLAAAASLRAAASAPPPDRVTPVPATLSPEAAAVPAAPSAAAAAPLTPAPTPAAPVVQAAPVAAVVTAEAAPAPVAMVPAQVEQPLQTVTHPAAEVATEPAADAAPSATLAAASAVAEQDNATAPDAATAAVASPIEPAAAVTATPAPAARIDTPPAATPSSGKTFWQRLFGTAGRKPVASPSGWAADVAAATAASPTPTSTPAPIVSVADEPPHATAAAEPEQARTPDTAAPVATALPVAAEPEPAPTVESAAPPMVAAQARGAVEADAPPAAEPSAETIAEPVARDVAADAIIEREAEATPTAADTAQPETSEETAEADESATLSSGFPATEPADTPDELPEAQSPVEAMASGSAQEALFGSRGDVPAKELVESAALRFDPEKYLVGVLREAFMVATKWEVPTQFDCGAGFIVVDAERNELHSSLDDADLQALASAPLSKRSKVQTLSNLDYVRFKQALQESGKARCTRLDDAIWRAALWGSAGRLPAGTNPSRTVFLRQWPNLTRITPVPQGPRLAALWALRGGTVLDSCKQFNLPQRHVIGFYNGVWALNLLTEDGSFARRTQRKGARNRGLLTRLLGWLRR